MIMCKTLGVDKVAIINREIDNVVIAILFYTHSCYGR